MRVAVLGGGLCGLAAARELHRLGVEVVVFEAGTQLGGLVASQELDGRSFDRAGGHYLPLGDPELARWVDAILPLRDWELTYPGVEFQMGEEVHQRLPLRALVAALMAGVREDDVEEGHLGVQLERTFGRPLARRWLIPWAEQLWGEDVTQLHHEGPGSLLPGFPAVGPVTPSWLWRQRGMLVRTRSTQPMGYPQAGMTAFADRLVEGVTVHRGHRVDRLVPTADGIEVDDAGRFDAAVSTLPADRMATALGSSTDGAGEAVGGEARRLQATRLTVGCFDRTAPRPWAEHRIRYVLDGAGLPGCHRMVRRWDDGTERIHLDVTGEVEVDALARAGERLGLGHLVDHATTSHAFPIPRRGDRARARQLAERWRRHGIHWAGRWTLSPSSMPSALQDGRHVAREVAGLAAAEQVGA